MVIYLPHRRKAFQAGGAPWQQDLDTDGTNQQKVGDVSADTYTAGSFTASNTGTITNVVLQMRKDGTPSGRSFTVAIYDDSSGEPGSAITNGSITGNDMNALSSSYQDETFVFSTPPSITATTAYWIVIFAEDAADATNYMRWRFDANETGEAVSRDADGVGPWNSVDATATIRGQLNGT